MSTLEKNIEKPEVWFDNNIATYKSLAENVANTLKTALDKHKIMYVDVPCRAKDKKSFLKKLSDKKYNDICDMMDLAGIRIITLVEDDLNAVEELIRKLFNVHEKDSVDKDKSLGVDKFGYRSRHFICDIGSKRSELIELDHFTGLRFEIQLRTALAHAWAEIEHDRGYKLEGGLPEDLKRRLNIVAAMLEAADNEFNRLTKDIDAYSKETTDNITKNKLSDIELSSIAIHQLLTNKYESFIKNPINNLKRSESYNMIKMELSHYNIDTIEQLDHLIAKVLNQHGNFLLKVKSDNVTDTGFIRIILMLSNFEHYFQQKLSWNQCDDEVYNLLVEAYSKEEVDKVFKNAEIILTRT